MDPITLTLPMPVGRARWTALGLVTGLVAAATVLAPAIAPRPSLAAGTTATDAPQHTITVTGTGRSIVQPDIADIRLGVTVTKSTVKAARAGAASQMNGVIAAIKKLGIADKDIQTTTISLQPNYAYSNSNPPRLTGYTLSNGIAVTVRNLDQAGDVIDDALAAGATTLDGVSFRVGDPAAAESQARTDAMTEAKGSAETLAKAAGVTITGVASISEVSTPVQPPVYFGAANLGPVADAATPVQPGTTDITITVTVSYLIG
jgi:uncharacterized protein